MSGQAAEETCRGRVCFEVVHIVESRVWVVLLTCDQTPLDMVRRRWPLGTPGTPARAPPRPQGLDETLICAEALLQNDRQSESSLGLSLAVTIPSCYESSGSKLRQTLTANLQQHSQQAQPSPDRLPPSKQPCPNPGFSY